MRKASAYLEKKKALQVVTIEAQLHLEVSSQHNDSLPNELLVELFDMLDRRGFRPETACVKLCRVTQIPGTGVSVTQEIESKISEGFDVTPQY